MARRTQQRQSPVRETPLAAPASLTAAVRSALASQHDPARLHNHPLTGLLRAVALRHATPMAMLRTASGTAAMPITFLGACNGQWEGGGFRMASAAPPHGGQRGVGDHTGLARRPFLRLVSRTLKGAHAASPHLTLGCAARFWVELA